MRELAVRILVAIVAIPFIAALILFGKIPLVLLVCLVVGLGMWEYFQLTGVRIQPVFQIIMIVQAVFTCWLVYFYGLMPLYFSVLAAFGIVAFANTFRRDIASASTRMLHMFFGFFYVGLMNFMILIRELEHIKYDDYRLGGIWLWFLLVVIWVTDTAAYFVGRAFGRHKLSPIISPKKTIEGFLGGLVFGTSAAFVFSLLALQDIAKWQILVAGFMISLFGQLGDLVESLLKRRVGIKDSSGIIPGHGGVLDRFDSTLFALPTLYFLLICYIYVD
jgi:phosphatidate cytidylyltransferase